MNNPFKVPLAEWSPGQGIALLLLCLLLLLIPLTALNLFHFEHSKQVFLERYEKKLSQDLLLHTRHLREQVINVQQWLTDISVTRGLDGLDQGFDQAHQSTALFREGLTTLRTILGKKQSKQSANAWVENLSREFDLYVHTGIRMAEAYIRSGIIEGNPLMRQFDDQAIELGKKLTELAQEHRPLDAGSGEMGWFRLARIWHLLMGKEHYQTYAQVQQQLVYGLSQNEKSQLAQQAQALREDILQTQQWLTDVSATRAQEGMDDGFQLAQERADHFLSQIQPFRELVQATGNPEDLETVDRLEQEFPLYYATGLSMARSYIQEGTQQGNTWMKIFDQHASQLVESLRPFLGKMLDNLGLEEFQVLLVRQALENTRTLLWVILTLLLLLLAGTAGWLCRGQPRHR